MKRGCLFEKNNETRLLTIIKLEFSRENERLWKTCIHRSEFDSIPILADFLIRSVIYY